MRRALALVAAFGLIACKSKHTIVLYTADERPALDVNLLYAFDSPSLCGEPESWLLRLDTEGPASWDYTLLFDSTRTTIYGCTSQSQPCAGDAQIAATFGSLSRVMVESLSVAPEDFAGAASGINVLCRGIADDLLEPDAIAVESPTAPTPAPSPVSIESPIFHVTVRMLKVGGSNPMPFSSAGAAPSNVRHGAAASFASTANGIGLARTVGDPFGRIALFGGRDVLTDAFPAGIWIFHPLTLSFTEPVPSFAGRVGAGASVFVDASGPGVLFAGGADESSIRSIAAALVRPDGTAVARPMQLPHAFAQAAFVSPARVAIFGGGGYTAATGTITSGATTYQYFDPSGLSGNCSPERFCTPSGGSAASGFRGAAVPYVSGFGAGIWVLPGDPGSTAQYGFNFTSFVGAFDPFDLPVTAPATATITGSGSALDGHPLILGGLTAENSASATNRIARIDITGVAAPEDLPLGTLTVARGDARAVVLRDRTVLVFGGKNATNDSGLASVDRVSPTSVDPSIVEAVAPMLGPRYGFTATRLEQTGTWLDGAVLISGGAASPAVPPSELFVPAYECAGLNPVGPYLPTPAEPHTIAGLVPQLCDRNRAGQPITDPDGP